MGTDAVVLAARELRSELRAHGLEYSETFRRISELELHVERIEADLGHRLDSLAREAAQTISARSVSERQPTHFSCGSAA